MAEFAGQNSSPLRLTLWLKKTKKKHCTHASSSARLFIGTAVPGADFQRQLTCQHMDIERVYSVNHV